jgi:hypothetical protein
VRRGRLIFLIFDVFGFYFWLLRFLIGRSGDGQ